MPRNKHYLLTQTAEQDFKEAKRWSIHRWGKELTKQYFSDLHNGAEYIAKNIQSIASNDHLSGDSGLGIYAVREHYIVYVPVKDNFIIIVSLIRQTRDVPTILEANSFRLKREVEEAMSQPRAHELVRR